MRSPIFLSTLLATLACAHAGPDEEFFEKRIRPVLAEHCTECHSASAKTKGGLRLDSRGDLLAGGDTGPAVVVGKPNESLLVAAISHRDKDLAMPAKKPKLPDSVIADFEQWVRDGVVWPGGDSPAVVGPKFDLAARKERLPWIWQIPARQPVPQVGNGWAANDADRFIFAKLTEKGLTPAPAADDRTWLRRVHFVITGLPPTREAIHAFLEDASPARRERAVDGLLASPHFGERWARHWMDLVRYAESRGHEDDYRIANAWRYRDYLIRAFNADVPYQRFVAEHIAGDLLPPRLDPATGANESVLATGWAFLGEEVHSPVDIRQDECERVDNKVDVLSKTFLGLTIACARCHDHKFDAITQRDYYALSGFVLGSPYRQVRFETMEAHSRAAAQLEEMSAKGAREIAAAFTKSLHPGMEIMALNLLTARRVILGESLEAAGESAGLDPAQLGGWVDQLKNAAVSPAHPLHFFSKLAHDRDAEKHDSFAALLARNLPSAAPLSAVGKVIADFTKGDATPWKSDGPVFGSRPRAAGEIIIGTRERPIARVMPYAAASTDPFWNRLSLTPGTEMESGILGAAGRAGRTLLTPKVTLTGGRLYYLLRGKAQIYAAVDSHIMINGALHTGLIANYDTGGQLKWVAHDLSGYAGHRLHVEIAPQGDAELDVLLVVESVVVPEWLPQMAWQPTRLEASLRDMAKSLQADAIASVESPGSNREARLAPLADWVVENAALLGGESAPVCTAGGKFFGEQEALAKTIRWDSPTAASWADGTGVDEHILIRGKSSLPGAVAPRGLPEAFGFPRIAPANSSGRAELARQLADPSNPLIARVMVNRVWHHLFGRGIVPTVDNFGYLGERPTHPELLDHLAWQFVHEDDWSLKRLIKRLALTSTFAMSSHVSDARAAQLDPTNALLHRMPVRRLEGEAIRDALLVVSGRFDPKVYGPPVQVNLTDFIVGRGRPETSGPLDGAGRRSVYTAVRRNFLPTMMVVFDYPTPFSTVGRRNVTNVPAQSLALMNDPFVHEQARVGAARLLRELPNDGDETRLRWLFETACARPPGTDEMRTALETLAELRALETGNTDADAWSDLCHALLNSNDFIYLK